jgi:hypothetical protein
MNGPFTFEHVLYLALFVITVAPTAALIIGLVDVFVIKPIAEWNKLRRDTDDTFLWFF